MSIFKYKNKTREPCLARWRCPRCCASSPSCWLQLSSQAAVSVPLPSGRPDLPVAHSQGESSPRDSGLLGPGPSCSVTFAGLRPKSQLQLWVPHHAPPTLLVSTNGLWVVPTTLTRCRLGPADPLGAASAISESSGSLQKPVLAFEGVLEDRGDSVWLAGGSGRVNLTL